MTRILITALVGAVLSGIICIFTCAFDLFAHIVGFFACLVHTFARIV